MTNRQSGFTLPEAVLALVIVVISLFGLLRAFSYGVEYVEREGMRRQALGFVQQRLEWIRSSANLAEEGASRVDGSWEVELTRVVGDEQVPVPATLFSSVSSIQEENGLTYRQVNVSLTYNQNRIADTVSLGTRIYGR